MYILGIDTSTLTGGAALLQKERLLAETVLSIRATHSERLLPALEKLLEATGLTPKDLDLISVAVGPGSFTGLRIGVATAKGLSFALGLPAVGLTTLEAFGWQFSCFPFPVIAAVDARRNNVYWQAFAKGRPLTAPAYGAVEEVLSWCRSRRTECLFVGDGALNHRGIIREQLMNSVFPPEALASLRPASLAHLGYIRFLSGEKEDAFSLNPVYLRKTEAELKWRKQK